MKFENTEIWGFEHAIRGMRNPLNSWSKSDSRCASKLDTQTIQDIKEGTFIIGENDMNLAKKLINGGSEHRKFLRQIFVSVDITAPLYWWKEFDTYKVGTTTNSTSTMHKLASTPITLNCFETDDFDNFDVILAETNEPSNFMSASIEPLLFTLENIRQRYLKTKKYIFVFLQN